MKVKRLNLPYKQVRLRRTMHPLGYQSLVCERSTARREAPRMKMTYVPSGHPIGQAPKVLMKNMKHI
jgi:hypothetical protein